jgi:hypothetical protein
MCRAALCPASTWEIPMTVESVSRVPAVRLGNDATRSTWAWLIARPRLYLAIRHATERHGGSVLPEAVLAAMTLSPPDPFSIDAASVEWGLICRSFRPRSESQP